MSVRTLRKWLALVVWIGALEVLPGPTLSSEIHQVFRIKPLARIVFSVVWLGTGFHLIMQL